MSFKHILEKELSCHKTESARIMATLELLNNLVIKKSKIRCNEIDICEALLCLKDISSKIPKNKKQTAAKLENDLYKLCNSKVKKASFWKFITNLFK